MSIKYLLGLGLLVGISLPVTAKPAADASADKSSAREESGADLKELIEKVKDHLGEMPQTPEIKEFIVLLNKFDAMNDVRHEFSAALKKLIEDTVAGLGAMAESMAENLKRVDAVKAALGDDTETPDKDDADQSEQDGDNDENKKNNDTNKKRKG